MYLKLIVIVLFFSSALSYDIKFPSKRHLVASTLAFSLSSGALALDAIDAAFKNSQITYSNNAKNFARMGQGDYTMGQRDVSQSDRAKKRRAMKFCKNASYRSLAVKDGVNEKDCSQRVLVGDMQFILDAVGNDAE